jgi:hypothetical protein
MPPPVELEFRNQLTAFDLAHQRTLNEPLQAFVENALSGGRVLSVAATRSAVDLAGEVDTVKPDVVIVTDQSRVPAGYVFPDWVRHQVIKEKQAPVHATFGELVEILAADPLVSPRTHLHEWLNFDRPFTQTCPGPPRHDTVGTVPCSRHRKTI